MATLYPLLVKNLEKKDGTNTVRIALSHNGRTRYFITDVIVKETEFSNGRVIRRKDSDFLNVRITKKINEIENTMKNVSYTDSMTCNQLYMILKQPNLKRNRMVKEVFQEFLDTFPEDKEKTIKLYQLAVNTFIKYIGFNATLEEITPIEINQYIKSLRKKKLSLTTANIYCTLLRIFINYAIDMKYVKYEVHPFKTAKVPSAKKRDTFITVEQVKKIRDTDFGKYNLNTVRDIFMLTYYLAGMNLVDMLAYNFKGKDTICYTRKKTRDTKDGETCVKFTIPEEAKPLIKKYMSAGGRLVFGKYTSYESCYNVLTRKMKILAEKVGIDHAFTLYSARKSFVQHGFELKIPISTLEYSIGQSMKEDRPIFNYLTIMQSHADEAIRRILDNIK